MNGTESALTQNGIPATPSSHGKSREPMLLLHLDINKTVIQSDSIQMKSIEEGLREGIAELFWGRIQKEGDRKIWEWSRNRPSCSPPHVHDHSHLVTYATYCKQVVHEKDECKICIRSFKLVTDDEVRNEMGKVLDLVMKKLQLPPEVRFSREADDVGLKGSTKVMFPAVFHLVSALQRSKRKFGILFRSFGADHENIKQEWNAFCEMRHPLYSSLIQGVGPLDGTVLGVPDRRIHSMHTLYRDAEGPMLVTNTIVEAEKGKSWDKWAKQKPRAKVDTRDGREYIKREYKDKGADIAEGFAQCQKWMRELVLQEKTSAIKDDWSWWTWNGEQAFAGKLLTVIGGSPEIRQVFFDDNCDHEDPRIVDCRDEQGHTMEPELAINKLCCKVNSVEAIMDDEYFLRKLQICHGGNLLVGSSLIDFQRQLTEIEEQKKALEGEVKGLSHQLRSLTEENRRMKILHRINVESLPQLRDLLSQHIDLDDFGKDNFRKISDLFAELEQGQCWLELDADGKLVRIFEMLSLKIQYKDLVLIESHELYSDGRIVSRNHLPVVQKSLRETSFKEALDVYFEKGLEVNLQNCVMEQSPPAFNPEALTPPILAVEAFPIPCKVQQFEATWAIQPKANTTHKDLLGKIGLPNGKNFTTERKEPGGGKITHFWRWDKLATWEVAATNTQMAQGRTATAVNVSDVCEKLFGTHRYREVYENLLLQMFETFVAKKLCGGFSGSMVIRVQPFEADGRPGEPCIVKLDRGDAIEEEHINSVQVFQALPDRAARIIGDAAYAVSEKDGGKFGAMRLELAGACWNVPELAQGSSNLLSTLKDLLLYESEQQMVGVGTSTSPETRPFGSVNTVLAETFGPGGMVSSLRKGGKKGVYRHNKQLPWGWYTLKGKNTEWNPYNMVDSTPGRTMQQMYKKYFECEMPDLRELVQDQVKPRLEALAKKGLLGFRPLVSLGHGDLNSANIMIDALDAVWLIDFATSVDLPLLTDLCKFEMACLFEYAIIPMTPETLMDLVGEVESWEKRGAAEWLSVHQDIAICLLKGFGALPREKLSSMDQGQLDSIINEAVSSLPAHKQAQARKSLSARLTTSQAKTESAFRYCANISKSLLSGDCILDTLKAQGPRIEGPDKHTGCASLRFFMDVTSNIRLFMLREIALCYRELPAGDLEVCDALSLQMWLPFLKESYRIIGYPDVPPAQKLWSIYHCTLAAQQVLRTLDMIESAETNLRQLPIFEGFLDEIMKNCSKTEHVVSVALPFTVDRFTEADSRWIHANRDLINSDMRHSRIVQLAHMQCTSFREQPGLFAPVFQIQHRDHNFMDLSFANENVSALEHMPWRVRLKDEISEDPSRAAVQALLHVGEGPFFGEAAPGKTSSDPAQVRLRSRLCFLPVALLREKLSILKGLGRGKDAERLDHNFIFADWSRGLSEKVGTPGRTCKRDSASMFASGRGNDAVALAMVPEIFLKFLTLEAVVVDQNDHEIMPLDVCLGMPALCYPCSHKLCLDLQRFEVSQPEIAVVRANSNGGYSVRDCQEADVDTTMDFDPKCDNHIYLNPRTFKVGDDIILRTDKACSYVDAKIFETASESSCYRYGVQLEGPSAHKLSDSIDIGPQMGHVNSMASDSGLSELSPRAPPPDDRHEKVYLFLSSMQCCEALLSANTFEEELHKMKAFYRARHSSFIDPLSGTRLDVRTCSIPTLHVTWHPNSLSASNDLTQPLTPSLREAGKGGARRATMILDLKGASRRLVTASAKEPEVGQDLKHGWNMIVSAMESYNKAKPSCLPGAFWVSGAPGSGKNCFLCRVIMDSLQRYDNLVPLRLPILDIAKRTDQMPDLDYISVQAWFDKYLRILFGEDTPRYKLYKMAMSMRRAILIFEGLDGAGQLMKAVEILIEGVVKEGHLTIMTSRPQSPGSTSLEGLAEYIVSMEMQPLTDEQKRSIAHSRLGLSGLQSFNAFLKKLRAGQKVVVNPDAHEQATEQDDVFGNPMMLSMLLCYLSPQKEQGTDVVRKRSGDNDSQGVDLMAVYRVAVTVMLKRMLLQQQADRHISDDQLALCSRVLERAAVAMQAQHRIEIECEAFEKELPADIKQSWRTLRWSVEVGRAMLLRMHREGDRSYIRFMIKGFQDYFVACAIANGHGRDYLPTFKVLITDPWWAQMLDMLANAWAAKYVQLMETKIDKFEDTDGSTFLHLAASVGHTPAFRLLKAFSDANQALLFKARDKDGQTPLHIAAQQGHTVVCNLILEKKAPIDVEDSKERLPLHLALQNGHWQTAKFLLDWLEEVHFAGRGGNLQSARRDNDVPSERLAARIVANSEGGPLDEESFKAAVPEIFIEMDYFGQEDRSVRMRQLSALLSVYWVSSNQYDKFIRGQKPEEALKEEAWAHLQGWINDTFALTPKRVAATLVYCAIVGIGKIQAFRKHFAADATEPIEALASIVQKHRVLVPSFMRLGEEEQQLIINCLKANFNFGQFLQAESLPVSLANCKEIVANEDARTYVFGFVLLIVFVSLCAVFAFRGLNGALFMNEEMYNNFRVGLEALFSLKTNDAATVYNEFLKTRAQLAGLEWDETDLEKRAIVRLVCLSRIFDEEAGRKVYNQFMSLTPQERAELKGFLAADGLHNRGFLLFHSPMFMQNASQNKCLTVAKTMRNLLNMYKLSEAAFPAQEGEVGVITIMVEAMANHAKTCTDPEIFDSTNLEVVPFMGYHSSSTGKIVLSPWQIVNDQQVLDQQKEEALGLFTEMLLRSAGESSFSMRLSSVFPEFRYVDDQVDGLADIRKKAVCTMMCLFWIATDRYEDFIRSQAVSEQLTEDSWGNLQKWLEPMLTDMDSLLIVSSAVIVRAVCQIPKFKAQQAPNITEPRAVMKHVLDNCPKVFPSYMRLDESLRPVVLDCLSHDFDLKQFLDVESPAASLTVLKSLMSCRDDPEESKHRLFLLMATSFLELAGSMGGQSQEGSLYMTQDRFKKLHMATESIKKMENGASETDVYNELLERRARACELTFDKEKASSRAAARLICLANIRDVLDSTNAINALVGLGKEDHAALIRHLTADGLEHKPAFAVLDADEFLQSARANAEIGLAQATRILLRVYEAADKEFKNAESSVVRIRFRNLVKFARDFMGSAKFQDVPFELKRTHELEAVVIPKIWIPVSNLTVLKSLQDNAFRFCFDLLGSKTNKMSEERFKGSIIRIYPELGYFGPNDTVLKDQTVCAMLCVYWLQTGQHEAFIRGQPPDEQLSRQSWAWIQDWLQKSVRMASAEALDAVMTFMAIHALGKFEAFREDFVRNYHRDMHDLALAQILQDNPEVVPSFCRLSNKYQYLILDCLRVDFQFSQFLQGENTAANLVMVKEKLYEHGRDGFSFFLFRIFAQMCGKSGPKSLTGSLFMNENQFKRCTPGLRALQQLWTLSGAETYNEFMLLRGSKAMSRFASPEHQALSRLLCLFDAYDKEEGSSLCNAFDELHPEERGCLTQWLNGDGVVKQPGYIICDAAQMLKNVKENRAVGLASALRMMLKVRQECSKHFQESEFSRVVVHFGKVADWAKDACASSGDFLHAVLSSRSEVQSGAKVIFVNVIRPGAGGSSQAQGSGNTAAGASVSRTGTTSFHLSEDAPSLSRPSSLPSATPAATPGHNQPVVPLSPLPAASVTTTAISVSQATHASDNVGHEAGMTRRHRLPIGAYSLATIIAVLLILAASLGNKSLVISWRQLTVSILVIGLAVLAVYMRCYDIPVDDIFGDEQGPREPFLASLDWMNFANARSSREPQYSRLQNFDDDAP